jgi:hypothetical protein
MPVIQLSSNLNVRTYEPAPAGFDPLSASDSQLLHYGFPTRPDAQIAPEMRKRWERAFSGKFTYIVPTFREMPEKTHGPRLRVEAEGTGTSSNWSGSVVFVPGAGQSFQWIEGRWTVPNPYPSTSDGKWDYASEWIGIDGDGSGDVLQAGTETDALAVGGTLQRESYAWWEWYPISEQKITNLPVSPGDIMYCLICVHSATSGSFYFKNASNGISTSFTVTAPAGTTLVGNCAEWIVERPSVNGSLSELANYGLVYFDEGYASFATGAPGSNQNSTGIDLGAGTFLTMVGNNNASLSVPTDESATSMEVDWEGAN